jgi:hypothetical protein
VSDFTVLLASSELLCPSFLTARTPTFVGHGHLGDMPDAASVNPDKPEIVFLNLTCACDDFVTPGLRRTCLLLYLLKGDFLNICAPSVRQNSIQRNFSLIHVLHKADVAIIFDL